MSSLRSEGAQGASPADCIAKLSSLLEHTLREGKAAGEPLPGPHYTCLHSDPPLYVFSTPLLNALLVEDSSAPPNPDQFHSFLTRHRDSIVPVLDTVSLECLSCYLLKLPSNYGLELGLSILMSEPEYIIESASIRSLLNPPDSENFLPLIRKSLIHKSYTIFTNDTEDAWARRMAGKVLMEMVYECKGHCQLLRKLNGCDLRPIFGTLDGMDIVLSFLASTMIRALYYSGTSHKPDWGSNGALSKIANHLQTNPDAIEQFHSYVRAGRQNQPSIGNRTSLDRGLPICYLVESIGGLVKGFPQRPVLLIFGTNGLNLIHFGKGMFGWKMDYIAIRIAHDTQTRCIFFSENVRQKQFLSLHIHADDSTMMNDQRRYLQTINLSVTGDDLTSILKGLKALGIRCQTDTRASPRTRRSSSLVVLLDTDDEIAPRYFQPSEVPSQTAIAPTSHRIRRRNESANIIDQLDYTPEISPENASQSSLTELTRTPTFPGTSSPRDQGSFYSHPNSPKLPAKGQQMEEGPHVLDTTTSTAQGRQVMSPWPRNTQVTEKSIFQNKGNFPEGAPARNTRSRSSQNERSVLTSTVLKPTPQNTQESLIFPRRRSRGKLYTAPTKTIVDWNEDTRASDDTVEQVAQRNAEMTSISSPLSSGTGCVFNQRLKLRSASSFRRKPAADIKRKSRIGIKRKGEKRPRRQIKPLSPPLDSVENGICQSNSRTHVYEKEIELNVVGSRVEDYNESGGKPDAVNSFSQSPQKANGISHQEPKSSLPQRLHNPQGQSTMDTSLKDDRQFGGDNLGRGQTVARKLIAAFGQSNTPEHSPDETHEKQFGDTEYGTEAIHESPEPHNELVHDNLHAEHGDNMRDMLGSLASNMSQGGSIGDEINPIEMYSVDSPDGSQNSPLQDNEGAHHRIIGKREAMFRTEGEQQIKRARWTSSDATSSLVEPRSMASTFEFYFTKPQLEDHTRAFSDYSERVTSYSTANKMPCFVEETSEKIATWDDNGAARMVTMALEEHIGGDVDRTTKCLESSSKTVGDRNGSPRLMQRVEKERVTPKQGYTSLMLEPRSSAELIKGLNQKEGGDATLHPLHTSEENQAKYDGSPIGDHIGTNEWFTKYTQGTSEGPMKGSSKGSGASLTAVRRSASSRSSRTGEHHGISENKKHNLKSQGYTAGKLPLEGGDPVRMVAFELSKGAASQSASQIDWQTPLQDLHKGTQQTLLSNSEHLARQIENERTTVNRALNSYREQCHTVLNQLFEAQMERIRLCRQQMESIKQQHADVCQGLIRRLEENERRLGAAAESQ